MHLVKHLCPTIDFSSNSCNEASRLFSMSIVLDFGTLIDWKKSKIMNVKVIFASLIFTTVLIFYSEAYISINIDPEDVERVGDFFHEIMDAGQSVQISQHRCGLVKKLFFNSIHLIGVMLSLVGANAISTYFNLNGEISIQKDKPTMSINVPNSSNVSLPTTTTTKNMVKGCGIDFGCHDNVCWRMCFTDNPDKHLWCYTLPNPHSRKITQCHAANDCSNCWECIEPCHP